MGRQRKNKADVTEISYIHSIWLRERDLNPRPPGYEPDELPNCSIPRYSGHRGLASLLEYDTTPAGQCQGGNLGNFRRILKMFSRIQGRFSRKSDTFARKSAAEQGDVRIPLALSRAQVAAAGRRGRRHLQQQRNEKLPPGDPGGEQYYLFFLSDVSGITCSRSCHRGSA